MDHSTQTARLLHTEHMEEVGLLERLDMAVNKQGASTPPSNEDDFVKRILPDFIAGMDTQINCHFAFEEEHLFPKLAENGEPNIGNFLKSEHQAIREVGGAAINVARAALSDGFTAETWKEFHGLSKDLNEWVMGHIQKEEMALLACVDQMIDEDEDSELAMAYLSNR